MKDITQYHFASTIQHLRHYEELMLFGRLAPISEREEQEMILYLKREYEGEAIEYPHQAPPFDPLAALWAAKTVYVAAQMLLYREERVQEGLLAPYGHPITPSAMVSADLMLRFLPPILEQLKNIDPEDALTDVLREHLLTWHYSGISCRLPIEAMQFDPVLSDACLFQLYIDRVIACKNLSLALHPAIKEGVCASVGMFADVYWSDFQPTVTAVNGSH